MNLNLSADDRNLLADQLEGLAAELAKRSLKEFAKQSWLIIEPDVALNWNWHHDAYCEDLEKLARGETSRLLYNVPPGTTKTTFFCVILPAWIWTWAPHKKFMVASYIVDKAEESVLKIRDLVKSPWYRKHFGIALREDQHAKRFFMNTKSGWILATSTDGRGTGEHPDFAIIDDPHSAKKARSPADRKAVANWLRETMSTRGLSKQMAIGLIMQRLHEGDLSGVVLSLSSWKHVCIPMRFEPEQGKTAADTRPKPDPRDPRTKKGELLWPSLMTEARVRASEINLGAYGVAGQFQQRPAPEGGGILKRDWFPLMDPPAVDTAEYRYWRSCRATRGWDTGATEDGGDYSAGVLIRDLGIGREPRFVVEDVRRGQWGPADVDKYILATARADGKMVSVREEQEPGSAGKTVCVKRARDLVGFDYRAVPTTGSKLTRLNAFRSAAEAGLLVLLRGAWNEPYLAELEVIPAAEHDDQGDGSSCAFNDLTSGPRPTKAVKLTWG